MKLKRKISIVGAGGGGSWLTAAICNNYKLQLIDHDIVEQKNIPRQNFIPSDVGKSKVKALADRYPVHTIYPKALEDSYIALDKHNADIIVSGVDNAQARRELLDYCRLNDKHFVVGVNEVTNAEAYVIPSWVSDAELSKHIPEELFKESPRPPVSCADVEEQTTLANMTAISFVGRAILSICGVLDAQWELSMTSPDATVDSEVLKKMRKKVPCTYRAFSGNISTEYYHD